MLAMKWGNCISFIEIFSLISFSVCAVAQNDGLKPKDGLPVVTVTGVFEGLVYVDGEGVYVITNYNSRSRVDYRVTGDLKEKVAALEGQVVAVQGTARRQGWSGSLDVDKILRSRKPPAFPQVSPAKDGVTHGQ